MMQAQWSCCRMYILLILPCIVSSISETTTDRHILIREMIEVRAAPTKHQKLLKEAQNKQATPQVVRYHVLWHMKSKVTITKLAQCVHARWTLYCSGEHCKGKRGGRHTREETFPLSTRTREHSKTKNSAPFKARLLQPMLTKLFHKQNLRVLSQLMEAELFKMVLLRHPNRITLEDENIIKERMASAVLGFIERCAHQSSAVYIDRMYDSKALSHAFLKNRRMYYRQKAVRQALGETHIHSKLPSVWKEQILLAPRYKGQFQEIGFFCHQWDSKSESEEPLWYPVLQKLLYDSANGKYLISEVLLLVSPLFLTTFFSFSHHSRVMHKCVSSLTMLIFIT